MGEILRTELDKSVRRLTLNRPDSRNALNLELITALGSELEAAARGPERVVVIAGAGGAFSSGGDIKDMVDRRGKAVATYERIKAGLTRVVTRLVEMPKPVIAVVDGHCLGAGLGVALACDAILASKSSTFGFPFVKVGLVPDTGTSWFLPRVAGVQAARRLLLTGESVDGTAAAAMGIVSQLYEGPTALDGGVRDWCARFAALPPTAVRDAKRQLWTSLEAPLSTALLHEAIMQGIRFTTEEHAQASEAFLAKRKV